MKKKLTAAFLIVETLLLVVILIHCISFHNWYYTRSAPLICFHATILDYQPAEDGLLLYIRKENSNQLMTCLIPNGKLKDVCTDKRCWPIIENHLTGVLASVTFEQYYVGEARLSEDFVYQLRYLVIPPRELNRIDQEDLLPD